MFVAYLFFFFQAEDGIRDKLVTGVQTCALPISVAWFRRPRRDRSRRSCWPATSRVLPLRFVLRSLRRSPRPATRFCPGAQALPFRSEERRVGKECRSWWSADR